jgi:membrane protein DedA with SNARE-associated domain
MLGFRFLYGLRSVTPFVIGMSRIPTPRFFLLNVLGAALWAMAIGVLGYLFGHALEAVLGDIHRYELLVLATVPLIGGGVWLVRAWRRP